MERYYYWISVLSKTSIRSMPHLGFAARKSNPLIPQRFSPILDSRFVIPVLCSIRSRVETMVVGVRIHRLQ